MGQDSQKIKDMMASAQAVKADDPELIEKLNEIALKIAEAQGKRVPASTKSQTNNFTNVDPMDELGCEGCQ